jgi:hypothetical protein
MKRLLVLFALVALAHGAESGLSDDDVRAILKVAAGFTSETPLQMIETKCHAIETGCSRQVGLTFRTSRSLAVSEIDGTWTIATCEREGLARLACLAKVDKKWDAMKKNGMKVDYAAEQMDRCACNQPSAKLCEAQLLTDKK